MICEIILKPRVMASRATSGVSEMAEPDAMFFDNREMPCPSGARCDGMDG